MNSMKAPLAKQTSVFLLASAFTLVTAWCASTQDPAASQSAPSGPLSFSFANSTAPVYDLTGSYQFDQQTTAAGTTPVNLSLGFSVQQDAAGRLRGAGVTNVQIGTNLVAARYTVTGGVSGGGGKATRAKMSIRWQSQDSAVAVNGPFTISVQYNLEVNQGFLNGTARGRARFAKGSSINTSVSAVPLPAGVDGSWRVTVNIQLPRGSGSIILPNGRTLQANLTGSFAARSGVARLKLSGTGGDRGHTLNINLVAASTALESISGKALGQTVALKDLSGSIRSQTVTQASTSSQLAGSQACLECHTPVQVALNGNRHGQVGVQCEGCHGPAANHAANDYDPASRPPTVTTFSTNDYFLNTTDVLATHYDTNINVCARCHNHFGASWTISSAPPPPSPQYNMLLGTVGELASGLPPYDPAFHALGISNQCVGCHIQTVNNPAQPADTGHRIFAANYGFCAGCHGTVANASNLVVFVTRVFTNEIGALKIALDSWATNKAPAALSAKYGTRAWEYTTPGALSPGGPGPDAVEQTQIPVNIQKARFNLYLVLYDGSFGVHNGPYGITLLDTAQNWVQQELSQ